MPVHLVREGALGPHVPISGSPFWIGRDPACQLVIDDERVEPRHARVRYLKGEHVLSAAEGAEVWVNGRHLPMMILHDGDEVAFADPFDPRTLVLRFENRMRDAFIPDGASWAEAWASHPGSRDPDFGPGRFGPGAAIGKRSASALRCVDVGDWEEVVVKTLGACPDGAVGDRFFRLLTALAGAPHPAVAAVVDGGLAWQGDVFVRWMATHYVDGLTTRTILKLHGFEPAPVVRILRTAASGLAHLHARGVVHRDVSPGNLVVEEEGDAVLIDFDQAVLWETGVEASTGVVGTPGYLAPEEVLEGGARVTPAVDLYGLAAVGYALLSGAPPATGEDLLDTLSRSTKRPMPLREMGIEVPDALEGALLAALSPDVAERPTAEAFERAMLFAEAQLEN